ncbi:hypothetical protein [Flavobacterium sp.]|uniref:hypothetical protein n=1 Tax=Flavobacterium sp. TaxID=239 RepID=UPI00261CF748|nr:hypothetical protein [Flavobacterium sp.]
MKHVFIVLFAVGVLVFYGNNPKKQGSCSLKTKTFSDTHNIRLNGVYSLYDTFKGVDSIEAFKKFIYHKPILFLKKGYFIQNTFSTYDSTLIAWTKGRKSIFDYGRYYFSGDTIHLEGLFTFLTTGMDHRQYLANYTGYLDTTGDTLYLKLAKPFPKMDMKFNKKFNKRFFKRVQEGLYQKYIFKPLPKDDIPVDINIEHLFPIQKKKKRR